jgi:DNA replication protein DnaC
MAKHHQKVPSEKLRERILGYFSLLRVPLKGEHLDAVLTQAERERFSHLEFLERVIAQQANERRERSIEWRIRQAQFAEIRTLEGFDWEFNQKAIDRVQIEALATCDFIRRGDNLALVGQSGVGKSHLMQAIGRQACVLGYRVRYTTSAGLLADLTASLADKTLPQRLRYYGKFQLLIIDEFGFDKIERLESPQAGSLMYKVVDSRRQDKSTILITNVDFEDWSSYLGDPPLAMGILDRLVDNAIIIKIVDGKSYRASRAKRSNAKLSKQ